MTTTTRNNPDIASPGVSKQWRLAAVLSVLVLLIITAVLSWFVQFESERFRNTQTSLANTSGLGVVRTLNVFVAQKREALLSMVHHESSLLNIVVENPDNDGLLKALEIEVKSHAPDYYSYMLCDNKGAPLLREQASQTGSECGYAFSRLTANASQQQYPMTLHGTNTDNAHLDAMAHLNLDPQNAIFVLSFKVDAIIEVLRNAELPSQSILVVTEKDPAHVEISTLGGFQSLFGKQLSPQVQSRVLFQKPIADLSSRILVVTNSDIFGAYRTQLIQRTVVAIFGILAILLFSLWRLWVVEKSRLLAQEALQQSHQLLEHRVKQRTNELALSEQNFRKTFMSAPYGMLVIDQNGAIESINEQATQIFGYSAPDVIGQPLEILIPERFRQAHKGYLDAFNQQLQTRLMGKGRFLYGLNKSGEEFAIEIGLSPLPHSSGNKVIASVSDVSEVKRLQKQLMDQHELAVVTLGSIGDGVISTNTEGIITTINTMAEKLTGWNGEEAIGRHIDEVFHAIHERTGKKVIDPVMRCLQEGSPVEASSHTTLIHRNGMDIPIEDVAAPIQNSDGKVVGVVLVFHDDSQSRAHANEIEHQANHDALTGLMNRRKFDSRLAASVEQALETGSKNVLLFMDLDRFKRVNDTAGHAAGDELLKQLTGLLASKLRTRDALARLGGDEFAVILQHCSDRVGLKIANKLRATVESFRFFWEDQVFSVGISIGMVSFSQDCESADNLLSEADAACYTAKEGGRNRVHVYDTEAAHKRSESGVINMLEEALDNNRMQLYQQRIQATDRTEKVQHCEVLVRMPSADGGILPPALFLPAAERFGLATALDRWVVKTSFEWLEKNQRYSRDPVMLAINLSGQSITDNEFRKFIRDQFEKTAISTESICFEITETAAMKNLDNAINFIGDIKKLGCKFSLDDFGSGHASYAHLKHLPVDHLKIDGLFVKDILDDDINLSIVKSVNEIGHSLGLKTIAEFVENDEIIETLTALGVDYLQGYGIARPQPLDDMRFTNDARESLG